MINLIQIAPGGTYKSGKVVDGNQVTDISPLVWNGTAASNGIVSHIPNAECEDDKKYNVLRMYPKLVSQGTVSGILPEQRLPQNAVFKAKVGFLKTASPKTDGVTFQVWEHHKYYGRIVSNRVMHLRNEKYDGKLTEITADLSHLSGKDVSIELRVDAQQTATDDHAVWVEPRVETRNGLSAKVWQFRPVKLAVKNRQETRRIEGRGDEPYLGAIYFRSVFGRRGSTKVAVLDELKTLGNNVGKNKYVTIPYSAGLAISDAAVAWDDITTNALNGNGIQVMGIQLLAMERDQRGKKQVREQLNKFGERLFAALEKQVEKNLLGLLNPEQTLQKIEDEVFQKKGGLAGGSFSIIDSFSNVLKYLGRADDIIGQNTLIIIGSQEKALQLELGDDYQPSSKVEPIGALQNGTFNLDFKGSGAHYTLEIEVRRSGAGSLVQ